MPSNRPCCIFACPNFSSKTRTKGVRLFNIPKGVIADRWHAWIKAQNFPRELDKKTLVVCQLHFNKDFILPNGKLAVGALPTISPKTGVSTPVVPQASDPDRITLHDILNSSSPIINCNAPVSVSRPRSHISASNHLENVFGSHCRDSAENTCDNEQRSLVHRSDSQSVVRLQSGEAVQVAGLDIAAPIRKPAQECDIRPCEMREDLRLTSSDPNSALRGGGAISASPAPSSLKIHSVTSNAFVVLDPSAHIGPPEKKNITNGTSLGSHGAPISSVAEGKKKSHGVRYIGDLTPECFENPGARIRHLGMVKRMFAGVQRKLKLERKKKYRLQKQVKKLKDLVKRLKGGKTAFELQDETDSEMEVDSADFEDEAESEKELERPCPVLVMEEAADSEEKAQFGGETVRLVDVKRMLEAPQPFEFIPVEEDTNICKEENPLEDDPVSNGLSSVFVKEEHPVCEFEAKDEMVQDRLSPVVKEELADLEDKKENLLLTTEERVAVIKWSFQGKDSSEIRNEFEAKFNKSGPADKTIQSLVDRFNQTGSVLL